MKSLVPPLCILVVLGFVLGGCGDDAGVPLAARQAPGPAAEGGVAEEGVAEGMAEEMNEEVPAPMGSVPRLVIAADLGLLPDSPEGPVLTLNFTLADDEGDPTDVDVAGRFLPCGSSDDGLRHPAALSALGEATTALSTSAGGVRHTVILLLETIGFVPESLGTLLIELTPRDRDGTGEMATLDIPTSGRSGEARAGVGIAAPGPLVPGCRRVRSTLVGGFQGAELDRVELVIAYDPELLVPIAPFALPLPLEPPIRIPDAREIAPGFLFVVLEARPEQILPSGGIADLLWDLGTAIDPQVLPAEIALSAPTGETTIAGIDDETLCLQPLATLVTGGALEVGDFDLRAPPTVPTLQFFSTPVIANFGQRAAGAYKLDIFYDPELLTALRVDPPADRLLINLANIRTGSEAGHMSVVGVNPLDIPEATCVREAFSIRWLAGNFDSIEAEIVVEVTEIANIDGNQIGSPVPRNTASSPYRIRIDR